MITQLSRALVALAATVTLVLGGAAFAPTAEAASGSVGIANPAVSPALDSASKGSITTPKATKHGKATITSRSYVIVRAGKVVARTSTAGKKIALPIGIYQVKTTVKFKVGKKKRTVSKSVTVKIGNSPRMTLREYNQIKPGQTLAQVTGIVGGWGTVTTDSHYQDCDYVTDVCVDVNEQRREYRTTSEYGFAAVYFINGRVDSGYSKFYGN